jgi:hypothetical protein
MFQGWMSYHTPMKWIWTCDLQNVPLKVSASSFAQVCLRGDCILSETFSSIFEYSSKALNVAEMRRERWGEMGLCLQWYLLVVSGED